MPRQAFLFLVVLHFVLQARPAVASRPDWEPFRGLPVVEVRIDRREVFDPELPEERLRLFAWANALHVCTRAGVVRRELLLVEGDLFDPLLAEESERNLRALGIFQDVRVAPRQVPAGVVLEVHTRDRWSTKVRTEISRQGGIGAVRLGLENTNLLGHAIRAGGSIVSSTDVGATDLAWRDPRFLGRRWGASFEDHRDDLARGLYARLEHPFYSETTRWSAGLVHEARWGEDRLFRDGREVERLDVDDAVTEGFLALHSRHGALGRLALAGARRRLRSQERHLDAAAIGLVWAGMQRDFRRRQDLDMFGIGEDVGTGWMLQLGAGADSRALGAEHDRPFWRADAAYARFLGSGTLVGAVLRQSAFVHQSRVEDGRLAGEAYGFWQTPGVQTFAWRAGFAALLNQPRFESFALGGDDRLRGHAARSLNGTRALWMGVEERLFSNCQLFFLRLGGLVFVDAAEAWDADERLALASMRLGAGFGLRVGNNKSGSGVTTVSLGFGNRSVEVSVSGGSFFRVARDMTYLSPRFFR